MKAFTGNRLLKIFAAALLLLSFSQKMAGQRVAVKTNALSWLALSPDIGVEVVTGEKTSVALSVFGQPFIKDVRFAVIHPEFRYWFNGRPLTREYIGISSFVTSYDMHISNRYFAGDGVSLGVTGGYVFTLGRRWSFELSAGTGILFFRQKNFQEEDRYDEYFYNATTLPNSWGYKLFPAKLAATFIYIIK